MPLVENNHIERWVGNCRRELLDLLSRRPHAPWTGQGNAGVPNSLRSLGSLAFP